MLRTAIYGCCLRLLRMHVVAEQSGDRPRIRIGHQRVSQGQSVVIHVTRQARTKAYQDLSRWRSESILPGVAPLRAISRVARTRRSCWLVQQVIFLVNRPSSNPVTPRAMTYVSIGPSPLGLGAILLRLHIERGGLAGGSSHWTAPSMAGHGI